MKWNEINIYFKIIVLKNTILIIFYIFEFATNTKALSLFDLKIKHYFNINLIFQSNPNKRIENNLKAKYIVDFYKLYLDPAFM